MNFDFIYEKNMSTCLLILIKYTAYITMLNITQWEFLFMAKQINSRRNDIYSNYDSENIKPEKL